MISQKPSAFGSGRFADLPNLLFSEEGVKIRYIPKKEGYRNGIGFKEYIQNKCPKHDKEEVPEVHLQAEGSVLVKNLRAHFSLQISNNQKFETYAT